MRGEVTRKTDSDFNFVEKFNTEKKAIRFSESVRWPKGRYCPICGSVDTYKHKSRKFYYHCRDCRKQFSCKANTIMQGSPLPVRTWLYAMHQFNVVRSMSSLQLSRETGVTRRTAQSMLRRIETACENQDAVLYGIMEINETYRGDKAGNKCAQKKPHAENNNGSGKQIQIAMHERNVAEEQSSTKRHAQQKIAKSGAANYGGGHLPAVCCVKPVFCSRIITGDVLKVLKKQPFDLKFDLVIADPPYNIGKDFGNNNDKMPIVDYVDWSNKWIAECFRLLADNGLVYVYGFHEVLARIAVEYPVEEQRWLAWHYTNKAVPSSKFWQRSHEAILCLWKPGTKRPNLEIDQIRLPYTDHFLKCAGKERKETKGRYARGGKKTIYNNNGGALPRDVIDVPALAGGAGRVERWFACRDCSGEAMPPKNLPEHDGHDILKHPTQKPIELTKRLIQSRINGNQGRVLIPFAGSGSECVVAKLLGVPYLGIEINPEFAKFGRSWVRQCIA
ncbi:DNA methyltransferase [Candidatus Spongiihabitans sp.]|uniref:DNA methyltransferase n=1 Tax=Candidatus Spongiihabitans sp. TaxID=3101308 RepID=UPI003C7AA380